MNLKYKTIAVDFDGTLVVDRHPEIGEPIFETINKLKEEQKKGAIIILWTCRCGEALEEALRFCIQHNIHLDYVNKNIPDVINTFGGDTRKIFATEYWDDRSVFLPHIKHPDSREIHAL